MTEKLTEFINECTDTDLLDLLYRMAVELSK